jgi:hypothetical protein
MNMIIFECYAVVEYALHYTFAEDTNVCHQFARCKHFAIGKWYQIPVAFNDKTIGNSDS